MENNNPEWVSKILELNKEEQEAPQSKTNETKPD